MCLILQCNVTSLCQVGGCPLQHTPPFLQNDGIHGDCKRLLNSAAIPRCNNAAEPTAMQEQCYCQGVTTQQNLQPSKNNVTAMVQQRSRTYSQARIMLLPRCNNATEPTAMQEQCYCQGVTTQQNRQPCKNNVTATV